MTYERIYIFGHLPKWDRMSAWLKNIPAGDYYYQFYTLSITTYARWNIYNDAP